MRGLRMLRSLALSSLLAADKHIRVVVRSRREGSVQLFTEQQFIPNFASGTPPWRGPGMVRPY